ncbi:hypothetical protein V5799_015134 [Amblyomma americanum]|uniref:Uncharacterized protein n=1 Tax=Amblyomma americanum TaxID=6943 RepID=A0AAQ4E113_AMBAM
MLATKRALEELLSLLRCAQCESPLQEPHVVGLCGHTVCRRCIGGRDACGVCGSPTTQRELGPDPQMSGVLACATKLGQLLASATSPGSEGPTANDGEPPASPVNCAKNVQGEVRLSKALPTASRKVAERRNRMGETPLQVAAIKGDAARVKALLSAGANPNVRDNAGWTPLHEASSQGALEVVRLLIAAGACVNAAGPDGITPLHDAVLSNVPDVVLLLRSAGANADASANDGRTPGSLAQNELMRAALRSPAAPATAQPLVASSTENGCSSGGGGGGGPVLLLASGLDEAQCQALAQCARLLGGSCATSFSRQVSHLVVTCDKQGNCCQRTLKVLSAMVAGTWIVNFSWVEECLQRGVRADEAAHEAQGVRQHPNSGAPQRARLSGGGTLFSCYSVVLQGPFARGPSRDELATLLTLGGAQLLARVPPSGHDQQTVLVVTDQPHASATNRSSAAVLVEPSWVLDSISRFELAPLPLAQLEEA